MRVYRLSDLPRSETSHIFGGVIPGEFISLGGISFEPPGCIPHADEPRHVHADGEIFLVLQGRAVVHLDDGDQPLAAGDVGVIEADENHHLEADLEDPCVVVWLEPGSERHPNQS